MNTDPISGAGLAASAASLGDSRGAAAHAPTAASPATTTSPASSVDSSAPLDAATQAAQDAQTQKAVSDSNAKLKSANVALQFQFDISDKGAVRSVKLLDSTTQKVVAQYPSEAMLGIRDQIDQMIQANESKAGFIAGSLFSKTA